MSIRPFIIFLFVLCGYGSVTFGSWKETGPTTFNYPIGCGFFFDENYGFIGEGIFTNSPAFPKIYRTTNGGTSWTECITPPVSQGRITSIYMRDSLIGYASISTTDNSFLWKTIDAGISWVDINPGPLEKGTCVYVTSSAVIETSWNTSRRPIKPAGVSFDDGITFNNIFTGGSFNYSNGIDFSDDMNGIVTMGPSNGGANCWLTHDGGRSWLQGAPIREAWSVYAVKGKNVFFILPEGDQGNKSGQLYRTTNTGVSWQLVSSPNARPANYTGHIAGVDSVIYIQTEKTFNQRDTGLFRSTDLGLTWKSVGGPSNARDTRFVVTGCSGEVVYAFDDLGGVWKTTDGGDGTLLGISKGPILGLSKIAATIQTHFCQVGSVSFPLNNLNCSPLVIDSIIFSDNSGAFSVVSSPNVISRYSNDSIRITYQSTLNETRILRLRLKGSEAGRTFDTILTIIASHSRSPEPILDEPIPTKVGDTVLIPVRILIPSDSINIKHIAFHLSYNGDLLTPIKASYQSFLTLSQDFKTISITPTSEDGLNCAIDLNDSITNKSDFTKPVIYLRFLVTLTKTLSCPVLLDSFAIIGNTPLSLCSIPSVTFQVLPQCADSTITAFMLTGKIPKFNSIRPNPANNLITIDYDLAGRSSASLEIINVMGVTIREISVDDKSMPSITIPTASLPSGIYYLRMKSSDAVTSQRITIEH